MVVEVIGIKTSRRRVVKNQIGLADDRARNRNPSPHPPRKLRRKLCNSLLQLDELQRFHHPRMRFFFRNMLFVQTISTLSSTDSESNSADS